ncbi:MAG: hypothetical protein COV45_02150 [Deltaproteobacteria bacterium CG11_big_fil_rev_8_21_14_0_20_47_16]|nr:MAG: hypothetical protein COV45_02150 [Deltaproteobacteria bacterium CG11_big_fil_rev_8_21_14_0_20_47_16]
MTQTSPVLWCGFLALVAVFLALDLGVFNRRPHKVRFKEALLWTVVWISLAMLFNLGIFYWRGPDVAMQFLAGYLIEQSLSVDNLFIFLIIFSYFKIAPENQHRILFWGIVGAIVMRVSLILLGTALVSRFHWIFYIFGGFLIVTAIKMALQDDEEAHPEHNYVVRMVKRFLPKAKPFLIVLVVIEVTDLIFALDSIPAVFAITTDPFIVFTSNIFAIMGLRSLFFVLSGFMGLFHYLKYGLATILAFVGVKMLIADWVEISIGVSLLVVGVVLLLSVAASLMWPAKK